ncbi:CocE/NonD family hydrolase [Smaragdicoccus niigatensis]|uniref:CocE/NonD family hydrolase n=1 Tax=Smaragdicoccus niigatensis TaxID=359359 RepID=UPI000371E369|nr:CocE/NonD family hydrolase [Smaragdicoccus niigatensis]
MPDPNAPARDRPWKRPGAVRYAISRIRGLIHPDVTVYEPEPGAIVSDLDVPIVSRDGTTLRANVYRPPGDGPFPVVMCAHPYGKDNLPVRTRFGYRYSVQYRMLRQPRTVRFSTLTSWEAPDPAWWVAQGYAVVNCDLREAGTSEGTLALLTDQEGEDVYDLVEWAGAQPWSNGSVGMMGVSYLAMSQWKTAALHPPSLKAIVPWEGLTDCYRDLVRPGGIREKGFLRIWSLGLRRAGLTFGIEDAADKHPLHDDWWDSLVPDLSRITVPLLICGSFSDNNLHSRGSFRAFERISSVERHVYTHRAGKWATFYSDEALAVQLDFFNRHLRGIDAPELPPVRLEVRESRDVVASVRAESTWPPVGATWTTLRLNESGLTPEPAGQTGSIAFNARSQGVRFGWTVPDDIEVVGPMALRLFVESTAPDVYLFVGVEKWRDGTFVPFEGSYGFGRDRVTTGWQKASMRRLDETQTREFAPVPTLTDQQLLSPGEVVQVDLPLGPSATMFRRGERLQLVVSGRWLWPRNPLTGQFPAAYESSPRGKCTLHWGPNRDARLLIPIAAKYRE